MKRMFLRYSSVVLLAILLTSPVSGRTTEQRLDGSLESRANRAFAAGDYQTALPLLRAVANLNQDDPAKLGVIQERIRVCEKALICAARQIPTTPGERKVHTAPPPGEVLEISIKELGNFDYDPEKGGIPDDVKKLSGSTVRLAGFMIPSDQADKITKFNLVPSLFSCCFGQPPQVQHTIVITCPKGKTVTYTPDQVTVEGVLEVDEKKDDGYVVSLFRVELNSLKTVPK
jgi:hypothetical protein